MGGFGQSRRIAELAMPETPSSTALPRSNGPGGLRPRRPVRLVIWLGAVALLAVAALVAAAVIPGSHHSVARSRGRSARGRGADTVEPRAAHG